jgi:hypothetical protein
MAGKVSLSTGKIVLSGKLNLPEGFGPHSTTSVGGISLPNKRNISHSQHVHNSSHSFIGDSHNDKISMNLSHQPLIRTIESGKQLPKRDKSQRFKGKKLDILESTEENLENEESTDSEVEGEDDEDIDAEDFSAKKEVVKKGFKNESSEEKRLRKMKVKEERKEKRLKKSILKDVFRSEGTRLIQCASREQSIDHVSVFKYSNM